MKKTLIASLCTLLLAVSCVDLDLAPKNIVTADDLLSNEAGMEIYLARMYSHRSDRFGLVLFHSR